MLTKQDLSVTDSCNDVVGNEEMFEESDERFVQITDGLLHSYYERGTFELSTGYFQKIWLIQCC